MSAANPIADFDPRPPARTAAPDVATDPLAQSPATLDLFDLGRRASSDRDARHGARGSFVRSRQLLATGAWRGPRDAAEAYVETADLTAVGGWASAAAAGARLLVGAGELEWHRAAAADQGRSLWRFSYRRDESPADRRARISELGERVRGGLSLWGVMPTPDGEPEGLDTLRLVATLRLDMPEVAHVVLDVAALGPRLAQMALGFGGDELWAPIVAERALRLGGNANNPALTRKEAAMLIRGASLVPRERTGAETYVEEPT